MFDVIFQETLWIVAMRKQAKYASAGVIWVPSSVPCWKYTTDLWLWIPLILNTNTNVESVYS